MFVVWFLLHCFINQSDNWVITFSKNTFFWENLSWIFSNRQFWTHLALDFCCAYLLKVIKFEFFLNYKYFESFNICHIFQNNTPINRCLIIPRGCSGEREKKNKKIREIKKNVTIFFSNSNGSSKNSTSDFCDLI